jgi:menaquinone-dependent protoporphyrinogen oxidase
MSVVQPKDAHKMKHILVTYATMAGSTLTVAQAVADEIVKGGAMVDVLPIDQVESVEAYDGVVVGGPMILGWHRGARQFLRRHQSAWRHIPVAVFMLAMSLTQPGETTVGGVPITVDMDLPKPPAHPGRLSFRERYAQLANYVRPALAAVGRAKPVSVGVFGGRLEYGRLPWWGVLFAMFIIRAPAGDHRNWDAIRSWAANLAGGFGLQPVFEKQRQQLA